MIIRPQSIGQFEFVVLASLRASQLTRGCQPRVAGDHTVAVTAQMEIAGGTVAAAPAASAVVGSDLAAVSEPVESS